MPDIDERVILPLTLIVCKLCNFGTVKLTTLVLLFLIFAAPDHAKDHVDLSERWRNYETGIWQQHTEGSHAVHFSLEPDDEGILEIKSNQKFTLFINDNLALGVHRKIDLSLDSLKSVYVFPIDITVIANSAINSLSTRLAYNSVDVANRNLTNYFFSVTTVLSFTLLAILILLFFTHGAVMIEYFNFFKVFSIRIIDESALIQRITSFNNVFIYGFLSLLMATNLITLDVRQNFFEFSAGIENILVDVLKLTAGVMIFLLIKIILVNVSSGIFKLNESAPNQFFNFVRLLLGFFSFISLVRLLIFVFKEEFSFWLPFLIAIFFIVFVLLLLATFVKLYSKGGFTVFHLFSYICISEIFPALLLLEYIIQ
jgi:hypothetical protein